ncbi:MAG: restriction endonuclease [Nitrospiraceae bacterium]|nr:MAG: restriction endonuclease [Nitrospiraceae bacterium]
MGGEWREVRLGEVADINPDAIGPDWPYAHIRYVDISSVGEGVVVEPPKVINLEEAPSRAKRLVREGDTVLSTVRPGRRSMFFVSAPEPDLVVSTGFAVLRPKAGILHPRYLYACVFDKAFTDYLVSREKGAAYPAVLPEDIADATVNLPPLPEQRAIAHILGTLDDKIELNRRMSETLEAMARALFKAWFVDFEPVRAKMEGRWRRGQFLPGLPVRLYDLFPDRLVDSELGEIPEGWRAARLGDVLAELVSGGRPKGGAALEGVPSIGAENVIGLGKYDFSKEKYVPREFFKELQRKGAAVRPGDVLLYKDGAQIGRKSFFDSDFPHPECAINEHVFILRCKRAYWQRYLFFWLDQDWMTQEIISLNSNSAQPGINQEGVRSLPFLMPPDSVVEAFDRLAEPLTDRLFAGCLESRTLAALRDALLPKLISGEIRVRDAERLISRMTETKARMNHGNSLRKPR